MIVSTRRVRAFTLVELLVVIGIIAALIGILLPVLSGVQARGRDIKCQSNLRQIVTSMLNYAAENKGSLPYGFYWNRSINHMHPSGNPDPYNSANTWDEAGDNAGSSGDPNNSSPFISWASQVGRYMVRKSSGDNDDANFPPVLRCPEADTVYPHVVSYVMNMVVGISPYYERIAGSFPRAQLKPASITMMLKEGTALVWDTPIRSGWENNVGYLLGADIDGQRFWTGADIPQFRYFTSSDIFGRIPPGSLGQNKPVRLDVGANIFRNLDPAGPAQGGPQPAFAYQGNLRFRHNKNQSCNVGFSDGSVRQFTAKKVPGDRWETKDALRKFFMTKWPAGTPANTSQPH